MMAEDHTRDPSSHVVLVSYHVMTVQQPQKRVQLLDSCTRVADRSLCTHLMQAQSITISVDRQYIADHPSAKQGMTCSIATESIPRKGCENVATLDKETEPLRDAG